MAVNGRYAMVNLVAAVALGGLSLPESFAVAVSGLLSNRWCRFGHFFAGSGAALGGGSRLAGWCGGCRRG